MEINSFLEVPSSLLDDDDHKELVLSDLNPTFVDSNTLSRFVQYIKPLRILQLGTVNSKLTQVLAVSQKAKGINIDITCIHEKSQFIKTWFDDLENLLRDEAKIELIVANTSNFFSQNSKKYDLVVVDGLGKDTGAISSLRNCFPNIELGGSIIVLGYAHVPGDGNEIDNFIIEKQLPYSVSPNGSLIFIRNLPYRHLRELIDFEIKLNLGCGNDYKEGWINIDSDQNSRADIKTDFLQIHKLFKQNSIAYVEMIHSFGYLNLWQARKLLRVIFGLLAPSGQLCLEMPNLRKAIEKINSSNGVFSEYLEGVRPFHAFGLDHMEKEEDYYPYAFSWSPEHLCEELKQAGFSDIKVLPPKTHSDWRDMRIEASKEKNLNSRGVLFIYDSELGHTSMYSRGLVHKEMLDKYGWRNEFVDFRGKTSDELVAKAKMYDVVYLIKMASIDLVRRLKSEFDGAIIFELADALWQTNHRRHGWHTLEDILSTVDLIAVENEYLSDFASRFNKSMRVPLITHPDKFALARRRFEKLNSDKVRIGWIGSTGTMGAVLGIKDQLFELCARNKNIELRIVGCDDDSLIAQLNGLPISLLRKYDEDKMFEEIVSLDIGLFPPPFDLEDYISRGAQKALLYMQGGIPAVCWNHGECADIISDGETGVLIDSDHEWVEKVETLVRNKQLRDKIGASSIESTSLSHSKEAVFKKLEQVMLTAINSKSN